MFYGTLGRRRLGFRNGAFVNTSAALCILSTVAKAHIILFVVL